jgi:hypothetical protein
MHLCKEQSTKFNISRIETSSDINNKPPHLKRKSLQRDWIQSSDQVYIIKFIVYEFAIIYDTAFSKYKLNIS